MALEGRVDDLYFGILLLDERLAQSRLTIGLLGDNLEKIRSLQRNGAAMQSDADAVEAELLAAGQQAAQIESTRASYRQMLAIFIGRELADEKLERPSVSEPLATGSARPELALFDARIDKLTAQEKQIISTSRPRLGLFAQGYYGYPGMDYFQNMITSDWSWNALVGVKLSWNFGAYYTRKNSLGQLRTARQGVEVQRDLFRFNNALEIAREKRRDRHACAERSADDDRIVHCSRSVREAAESKLRNGVIDTNDLLRKITEEETATAARNAREIELIKTIYELKHTINR